MEKRGSSRDGEINWKELWSQTSQQGVDVRADGWQQEETGPWVEEEEEM